MPTEEEMQHGDYDEKRTPKNKRLGSSFDQFLEDEGIKDEVDRVAKLKVRIIEQDEEIAKLKAHSLTPEEAKRIRSWYNTINDLTDDDFPFGDKGYALRNKITRIMNSEETLTKEHGDE